LRLRLRPHAPIESSYEISVMIKGNAITRSRHWRSSALRHQMHVSFIGLQALELSHFCLDRPVVAFRQVIAERMLYRVIKGLDET
jgi:hypothetical protein